MNLGGQPVPITEPEAAAVYDPTGGPLVIRQGAWTFAYDGKDSGGGYLPTGVYAMVFDNGIGVSAGKVQVRVTKATEGIFVAAAPNPVGPGMDRVRIWWSGVSAGARAEVDLFALNGARIRSFGVAESPLTWDIRTATGAPVANGIYWVEVRVVGTSEKAGFKLAVSR